MLRAARPRAQQLERPSRLPFAHAGAKRIYDMRLHHPLTLALRHLTPSRTIDGAAALPVWLGASGRLDLPGLAARLQETFAAGLTPAVNLFAGSVDRLGREQRMDVLATAAGVARGRRFIAGTLPTEDAAPLAARYGRAVDAVVRQGGTPLLLPIRELAALDGDALVHLWRQATAGHRGVLRDRDGGRVRRAGPALRRRGRHPHPRHRQPRRAGPRVARSRRRMGPRRSARRRPARLPHLQRPRARPRHGGLRQRLPARHRRLRARGLRRPRSGLAAGRTGRLRAERRAAGARHAALPRPDRRRPSWRAAMAAGARR